MGSVDTIRLGFVSSVNYKKGMIRVAYPDRGNSVTNELPVLAFGDEYKMPEVGSEVLVTHLSNGQTMGIVIGKFWSVDNKPPVYGKGVFHKEIGSETGKASIHCEGDEITFKDKNGTVKLSQILEAVQNNG